jgi:hypothetical protein
MCVCVCVCVCVRLHACMCVCCLGVVLTHRFGQNHMYTLYLPEYLVMFCQKYLIYTHIHHMYMVLANPTHTAACRDKRTAFGVVFMCVCVCVCVCPFWMQCSQNHMVERCS